MLLVSSSLSLLSGEEVTQYFLSLSEPKITIIHVFVCVYTYIYINVKYLASRCNNIFQHSIKKSATAETEVPEIVKLVQILTQSDFSNSKKKRKFLN